MWSHTDLDENMLTETLAYQGILSLILHIALGDDELLMPPYPRDLNLMVMLK